MFSEMMKSEIERHSEQMLKAHPVVAAARAGELTREAVGRYLSSLHLTVSHTPKHLLRADAEARARGHDALGKFLISKCAEEIGHEKWAEDDMRLLGKGDFAASYSPLPAAHRLVRYLGELAERDPRLYLVYSLAAEYFTVLAGPTWIRVLTEGCQIPVDALTVVSKHVIADQKHAAEGIEAIDEFITDPSLGPAMKETLSQTFSLYGDLFDEVVAVGRDS